MKKKISFLTISGAFFLFVSCKQNPVNRLVDPLPEGDVPQSSGIFIIYDDELKTGGGLGFIPGGQNQLIDLLDVSEPRSGARQLHYIWNGGDVSNAATNSLQHAFAGFSLITTPDFTTFTAATPKNFSSAGYTKLTFRVRGSVSNATVLRIEGPSTGVSTFVPARLDLEPSSITSSWQSYSLPVPTSDFSSVRVFMTATLQYTQPPRTTNPGEGGNIYLDNIQYER